MRISRPAMLARHMQSPAAMKPPLSTRPLASRRSSGTPGLLLALRFAPAACTMDAPPSTIPIERYYAEYSHALCGKLFACCRADELDEMFRGSPTPITDKESCEKNFVASSA